MARRKKGNPVHGWLVLDKPEGFTSTQALGAVKRLFGAQKAGHAGTLDPLATGILPIAFGEATKTVSYAVDGEKTYRFAVEWGIETDTDDAEGDATQRSEARPDVEAIENILPSFTGTIMQVPPSFSAIKIDGARAYDLARDGDPVELEPRPVTIDALRLVDVPDNSSAVFEAHCGKGTYVRSLARDMGRALGCYGHVRALRRTRVGPFLEENSSTLFELKQAVERGEDTPSLLPIEAVLGNLAAIDISQSDAASLGRGQSILIRGRDAPLHAGVTYTMCKGRIVALGEVDKGAFHPLRVFNFAE